MGSLIVWHLGRGKAVLLMVSFCLDNQFLPLNFMKMNFALKLEYCKVKTSTYAALKCYLRPLTFIEKV